MVSSCNFLNIASYASSCRGGDGASDRDFDQLKPRSRQKIEELFFWSQADFFERTAFTLLRRRGWDWVASYGDRHLSEAWRCASKDQKIKTLELFLNQCTQEKLTKENHAAQRQGLEAKDFVQFDNPPLARAPSKLFATSLSSLTQKVVQCLFFPWGFYALCSHFPFRNTSDHRVGVAHAQGRRPSMEDAHLIRKFSVQGNKVELFAVFDGHCGVSAAQYARFCFESHLKRALAKQGKEGLSDTAIFLALKEACLTLDASYSGSAGTTLCANLIIAGKLWTCNLGDSRSVLVEKGRAIQLSEDQKSDNPKYAKGAKNRNGRVVDINGTAYIQDQKGNCFLLPRAIGDHSIGCMVHTPKITCRKLSGSHLVIGCDGIWDVCTSSQAAKFVQKRADKSASQIAQDLVVRAYLAGSTDNLSALVVKL